MLPDDFLRHIVDQRPAVNEGGGVKGAILKALLDHLMDGGLREGPVVDLLRLLAGKRFPPVQHRLHLHLDQAVVRYLGYRVSHNSIGYPDVPGPQLVKLVALLIGSCPVPESGCETGLY